MAVNHRAVQRALFRMQLDPRFEPGARDGLGGEELALLRRVDPSALRADRNGRRRAQFLRNVSEEFALSCAAGVSADEFPRSAEFHEAVRADASLPLAFARYARRCSAAGSREQRALVELETALARARRELRYARPPARAEVALAPWVWLVRVPAGTLDLAARVRTALDPIGGDEAVLIKAEREPAPFRLRAVETELVSRALAELLDSLVEPRPRSALDPDAAEIVSELLDEGVLRS